MTDEDEPATGTIFGQIWKYGQCGNYAEFMLEYAEFEWSEIRFKVIQDNKLWSRIYLSFLLHGPSNRPVESPSVPSVALQSENMVKKTMKKAADSGDFLYCKEAP